MYSKFLNISSGRTFVISEKSKKYLDEDSSMQFLGSCNEDGTLITPADYKPRSLDKKTKKIVSKMLIETKDSFDTPDEDI